VKAFGLDELQVGFGVLHQHAQLGFPVRRTVLIGARHEVKSVSHAILMLGLERVKTLATMVAVNRLVRAAVGIEALRKVWLHSLVTAIVAEEAARAIGIPADSGYTAGLLHNLGTLGLMSAFPEEYSRMLSVTAEFKFDLLQTERDLFDIDHCMAGCYLAQDWDFPDELAAAIAAHHEDPVAGEASLDNVVKVSWRLADTLGYVAFPPKQPWTHEELLAFLPATKPFAGGGKPQDLQAAVGARLASLTA
jgi:putative nucleotidyltransferase with HDIG domain